MAQRGLHGRRGRHADASRAAMLQGHCRHGVRAHLPLFAHVHDVDSGGQWKSQVQPRALPGLTGVCVAVHGAALLGRNVLFWGVAANWPVAVMGGGEASGCGWRIYCIKIEHVVMWEEVHPGT